MATKANDQIPTGWRLHHFILLAMALGLVLGISLNFLASSGIIDTRIAQTAAQFGHGLGTLFLRLLQMVVVPLIICSLVSGITNVSNLKGLGTLGLRTLIYYLSTSLLAIVTGIVLVNLIGPGQGVDLSVLQSGAENVQSASIVQQTDQPIATILWQQLLQMIPQNPIAAAAEGNMLAVIFFSILLGVCISGTSDDSAERLGRLFQAGFDVMMKMTLLIIRLAPIGVFGYILFASADKDPSIFKSLLWYMLTVFSGLMIHAFVTLPLILSIFAKRSPVAFAQAMGAALITAFSTASSNATLPLTLSSIEQRAQVDRGVSAFVLPLGATINMDGTALYEAVAVLFIAQAYGIELSTTQQVVVAITALLASIGAAGIPHAGLVMMVVVLNAVQLPTTAVALILGVDRILDMCRTTVNVWSDSVGAAVIDKTRGRIREQDDTEPTTSDEAG